jgi:hypothetical protein
MENDPTANVTPVPPAPPQSPTQPVGQQTLPTYCPQCHQPLPPLAYYCPNCGKKLDDPPLPITLGAQLWLYAFSIILPFLGYLAISYWQGIKYARSNDAQRQQIGWIAIGLLTISSIYVLWQITALIQGVLGAATNTAGLSGL